MRKETLASLEASVLRRLGGGADVYRTAPVSRPDERVLKSKSDKYTEELSKVTTVSEHRRDALLRHRLGTLDEYVLWRLFPQPLRERRKRRHHVRQRAVTVKHRHATADAGIDTDHPHAERLVLIASAMRARTNAVKGWPCSVATVLSLLAMVCGMRMWRW